MDEWGVSLVDVLSVDTQSVPEDHGWQELEAKKSFDPPGYLKESNMSSEEIQEFMDSWKASGMPQDSEMLDGLLRGLEEEFGADNLAHLQTALADVSAEDVMKEMEEAEEDEDDHMHFQVDTEGVKSKD